MDHSSIHPLSKPTSSILGHRGAGAHLQRSTGKRRGTPWTGRQCIAVTTCHHTGQITMHTPSTPKGNLERPINLTELDCGQKPEYPERTHAWTGRTCKLHAERPPTGSRTEIEKLIYLNCHFLNVYSLV
ncbi:hypothetical protein XENOCAPTIV_007163 [Xenoophorus captivus]|uniref:Prolactin receptor n=1 Tax=Xenoophorus captivus TaxID=1517983 RepID=A0ABV0R3G5_9TELE